MWLVPILACIFGLVFAFLPAEPLDEAPAPAESRSWLPAAAVATAAMLVVSGLLIVTL